MFGSKQEVRNLFVLHNDIVYWNYVKRFKYAIYFKIQFCLIILYNKGVFTFSFFSSLLVKLKFKNFGGILLHISRSYKTLSVHNSSL